MRVKGRRGHHAAARVLAGERLGAPGVHHDKPDLPTAPTCGGEHRSTATPARRSLVDKHRAIDEGSDHKHQPDQELMHGVHERAAAQPWPQEVRVENEHPRQGADRG